MIVSSFPGVSGRSPAHEVVHADRSVSHENPPRLEAGGQPLIAIHGFDATKNSSLARRKLGLISPDRLELDLEGRTDIGNNVTGGLGQVQPVQPNGKA